MTLEELDQKAKDAYYSEDLPNALRYYAEAFIRIPTLALAYNNYGSILREMGFPIAAQGFLKTAMNLDPEDRNAPFNYAVAYLAAGDLEKGWELFEARWRFKHHEHTLEGWDKPRWNGENIKGKKLLITCEEGDGDNLQFIRFVHTCRELGITPIIQTEPNLVDLFKTSFPKYKVLTNKEKPPKFDYWTPIMSLPRCLKITLENFPSITNYLKPSDETINKWKNIIKPSNNLKVAYCCKGRSKKYSMEAWSSFMRSNPHVDWINLQADYTPEETMMVQGCNVSDYFDHISIWNDTAGLISQVDYVVTIDSGLAHLAGAMGKKVILLLDRYKTCWRWLYDSEDTIWYPTMHLVRQKAPYGYQEQLEQVSRILSNYQTQDTKE